jgi:hypothetical protein
MARVTTADTERLVREVRELTRGIDVAREKFGADSAECEAAAQAWAAKRLELHEAGQAVALTDVQVEELLRMDADEWRKIHGTPAAALEAKGLVEVAVRRRYTLARLTPSGVVRAATLRGET